MPNTTLLFHAFGTELSLFLFIATAAIIKRKKKVFFFLSKENIVHVISVCLLSVSLPPASTFTNFVSVAEMETKESCKFRAVSESHLPPGSAFLQGIFLMWRFMHAEKCVEMAREELHWDQFSFITRH